MNRTFDLIISTTTLFLTGPIMFVIYTAIICIEGRPALFRQERVGLNGKLFTIYKFRSMIKAADQIGGYSTAEGDRRITKIGRWLRKTSLDELPQLWNVINGSMSIVGPRPDVPAQLHYYSPDDTRKRLSVRPGITGLAQATLRSEASAEQRLKLDLQYVDNRSFAQDVLILMLTIRQITVKGGN